MAMCKQGNMNLSQDDTKPEAKSNKQKGFLLYGTNSYMGGPKSQALKSYQDKRFNLQRSNLLINNKKNAK